jgi:phosphatidylglycerol---prolipoprotein diacylglyceryl transferase
MTQKNTGPAKFDRVCFLPDSFIRTVLISDTDTMQPVFMENGPVTLHWYGVLFSTGFLAAAIHWSLLSRRVGMPAWFGVELCVWVIVSSVLGARLAYVAANWPLFIEEPARIVRIDRGGLVFYGGLFGATAACLWLAKLRGIYVWRMADYAISAVPLGHAIGRMGCFLNGCCFGAPSKSWWAIPLDGVQRHPVPLLESIFNLIVYILLMQVYRVKHREGRVFAAYLVLYSAGRFALEFLRGDPRLEGFVLNVAQELSLFLFVGGVFLWFTLPRKRHHHRSHANL